MIWLFPSGLLILFFMGFQCKSSFFISLFPASICSLCCFYYERSLDSNLKKISEVIIFLHGFFSGILASPETHNLHSLLFCWYHYYTAFTSWVKGWTPVVSILLVILHSWNTASYARQGIRHVLVFHWSIRVFVQMV